MAMKTNLWKSIYVISGLLGISAMAWGIKLYRLTFIDIWIPIAILVITSLSTLVLIKSHYAKTYKTDRLVYPILQSIMSVGFLVTSIFTMVNYYFPDDHEVTYEYTILKTGKLGGRHRRSYGIIRHKGKAKQLIFKQRPPLESSDRVMLNVQKGLLGFEIITEQKILN